MRSTAVSTQPDAVIRTPDQRLRVFVSSTLRELVEERNAAREAISRLRLTPVLFELGARPYPPRTLYRAYLEQSQVFIGIYWQQYQAGSRRGSRSLLEEYAAWAKESAEKMALPITLVHLGMARLDAGDVPGAWSALIEALELARDLDHRERTRASVQRDTHPAAALAWSLEAFAALAVATASHELGALLLGAAQGVRRSVGAATWAPDRQMHESTEHALRAVLGDDAFAAKFSEGTRISLEDALKLAVALP